MRLIDRGQQLQVGPGIALRKAVTPVSSRLHLAAGSIASDQPRHLSPAQPRHFPEIPPQQTPRRTALLVVLLLAEHLLDPVVNLPLCFAFEPDRLASVEKRLDLIQTQFLCFVHAGCQSSACHLLQAHLVLESRFPFRLILYWTRLSVYSPYRVPYTVLRGEAGRPALNAVEVGWKGNSTPSSAAALLRMQASWQ